MDQKNTVVLVMGIAFVTIGLLLTVNEKVARWGLSNGRGQLWAQLLGMERAVKLTRWFFGPVVLVIGAVALLSAFVGPHTP